jgi:hypothetical protein
VEEEPEIMPPEPMPRAESLKYDPQLRACNEFKASNFDNYCMIKDNMERLKKFNPESIKKAPKKIQES